MKWLRRMVDLFSGRSPDPELARARIEVPRIANRADAKVRDAVNLADRVFRGVERRRVPR